MLPILNKDKTPKAWSYTFGAGKLSELLAESEKEIDLFFYHREYSGLTAFKENSYSYLNGRNSYPSTNEYRKVITVIWVSGNWGVSIFSVSSQDRARVKEILEKMALPKIIIWLNLNRNDTWFDGIHRYEVGVNLLESKLCFWEIHNSDVVGAEFMLLENNE